MGPTTRSLDERVREHIGYTELTWVNPDQNKFSIKCGINIYFFFTPQRIGQSPSPNFKNIDRYVFRLESVKQFKHFKFILFLEINKYQIVIQNTKHIK